MKVGVVTIPNKRDSYLYPLIDVLEQSNCEVKLFVDYKMKGHTWNLSRTMDEMIENAEQDEPVLITADDVITNKIWLNDWNKIHNVAKNDIYTLFTRQRHLNKNEIIQKGYVTKVQPRGFYDPAVIYINQKGLIKNISDWLQDKEKCTMSNKRKNHFDVCIQDYFIYKQKEWTITIPSLFEHIGDVSSLGHSVGKSINYKYENI